MNGWTRLKLVLSAIYWLPLGLFAWFIWAVSSDDSGRQSALVVVGVAAFVYAACAAIWWAFAGFRRRHAS